MCFGHCFAHVGFNGGIREVVARNTFMNPLTNLISSNMVLGYQNDIKCYFRFNDAIYDYEAFIKDEFVDRSWIQFFDT